MSAKHRSSLTGHYYNKYEARNPFVRYLMRNFRNRFEQLLDSIEFDSVLDVGCAEGEVAGWILEKNASVSYRGFDLGLREVERAQQRYGESAEFFVSDIYRIDPGPLRSDLVVCCEVLEHLKDPISAVEILAQMSQRYLIASVPREPLWRSLNMVRGKYWSEFGNTPGHLQHWSSSEFCRLLADHFVIQKIYQPIPWTMVLASPK